MGPADGAVDLALVRPHLERRADLAESTPAAVGGILQELLVQRVLAHFHHRHGIDPHADVLQIAPGAHDVDVRPLGHGLQVVERLLRAPLARRIDQAGDAVGAGRIHLEEHLVRLAAQMLVHQRRPVGELFGVHVSPQRADDRAARKVGRVCARVTNLLRGAGAAAAAGREAQAGRRAQQAERLAAREPPLRCPS